MGTQYRTKTTHTYADEWWSAYRYILVSQLIPLNWARWEIPFHICTRTNASICLNPFLGNHSRAEVRNDFPQSTRIVLSSIIRAIFIFQIWFGYISTCLVCFTHFISSLADCFPFGNTRRKALVFLLMFFLPSGCRVERQHSHPFSGSVKHEIAGWQMR